MSIDSQGKMMNVLSMCSPLAWQFHFEVDGTIEDIDKAHLLHIYGGNDIDGAAIPTGRIMGSLAYHGGLAGHGGIAGPRGGIAG